MWVRGYGNVFEVSLGTGEQIDLNRDWYDVEPADYRRALDRMNS
jgi:hypothetical protein